MQMTQIKQRSAFICVHQLIDLEIGLLKAGQHFDLVLTVVHCAVVFLLILSSSSFLYAYWQFDNAFV